MQRLAPLLLALALFVGVGVSSPPTAHAKCRMSYLTDALILPASATLPANSNLLVELVNTHDDIPRGFDFAPQYTLVNDTTRIPLKLEPIAPGLARLVPEKQPSEGAWRVEGLQKTITVTFSPAIEHPPIAPPAVTAVTHVTRAASKALRRGQHHQTDAALSSPIPSGVVVVIARWNDKPDAESYAHATPGESITSPYRSAGRCRSMARGTRRPNPGDKATLHYVDAFGNLSPASPTVSVVQ